MIAIFSRAGRMRHSPPLVATVVDDQDLAIFITVLCKVVRGSQQAPIEMMVKIGIPFRPADAAAARDGLCVLVDGALRVCKAIGRGVCNP
jgi:hypothetical protein